MSIFDFIQKEHRSKEADLIREKYCLQKAKEKGIPESRVHDNKNAHSGKFNNNQPFNAFREMRNLADGRRTNLAPINETTAVVGKPIAVTQESFGKRKRDGDDERGDKKRVNTNEVSGLRLKPSSVSASI